MATQQESPPIMKEPFLALAAVTAAVAASGAVEDAMMIERIGALITGGLASCVWSVIKSRKRKAPREDAALWALVTLFGTMGLAFFGGPVLAGGGIMGLPELPLGLVTFAIAIGSLPVVEMMLEGRIARKLLKKAGLLDDGDSGQGGELP